MKYLPLLVGGLMAATTNLSSAANLTVYSSDGSGVVDKPVVLVEGYDPKDDYSAADYYYGLPDDFRSWLQNEGRDLVVMTFDDTKIDLKLLAAEFQSSLISVNNMKIGNHPTAVIGYSAGGLIARWGLKTMENQGVDHETSLYISYDTPHRGATIPESIIDGLNDLEDKIPSHIFGYEVDRKSLMSNWNAVNSYSAKQMLLGASYSSFLSEIESLGYPDNLARMAVANGSDSGAVINLPLNAMVYDYKVEIAQISNEYQTLKQEAQSPCSYPCDPSRKRDYDRAPGGKRNTFEHYWVSLEQTDADTSGFEFDLDVYFKDTSLTHHSFVNTLSAFDIKNFDITSAVTSTMKDYGPFDGYASNSTNVAHDIIDSTFANGSSGDINQWLTTYHKEGASIPSRANKKTNLAKLSGLDIDWLNGGRNELHWSPVSGATRYEVLRKTGDDYYLIKTVTGTETLITVSSTKSIAVRACNAEQCGYPDFDTAIWNSSSEQPL